MKPLTVKGKLWFQWKHYHNQTCKSLVSRAYLCLVLYSWYDVAINMLKNFAVAMQWNNIQCIGIYQ